MTDGINMGIEQGSQRGIVSSTGNPGPELRSDERFYVNATKYATDPEHFLKKWNQVVRIQERYKGKEGTTRAVFKGIVSDSVFETALGDKGARKEIEVAVPLANFGMGNSWLVYLGHNDESREAIAPIDVSIEQTSEQTELVVKPPIERVRDAVQKGLTFTDEISPEHLSQLHDLWGETFGWEKAQIENLRNDLEKDKANSDRSIWFSGILHDGKLVGAAMGQKLGLVGEGDNTFDLVESTEWRKKEGTSQNGFMPAALAMLNAQILESTHGKQTPLIFAECNLASGANVTGHKAGFQVPGREVSIKDEAIKIPQILSQNVRIGDGVRVATAYRDFAFMALSNQAIGQYYDNQARAEMLSYLY